MRAQTQWHYGPLGPIGLNYPGVEFVAEKGMGVEMTPDLFAAIQTCEREYLGILAENLERERKKK